MSAKSQSADVLLTQLKNPFNPKQLKWRVGATNKEKTKGIALAYLDAREVMKRLDDVCGPDRWQTKLTRTGDGFTCELGIKFGDEWIWKSNSAGDTKVESIKGGASDAFKRAGAVWGVGRYLYYLPNVWVALDEYKKLKEIPELPDWAKTKNVERWEDIAELEIDMQGSDPYEAEEKNTVSSDKMTEIVWETRHGNNS
jgi:hypothetical protein